MSEDRGEIVGGLGGEIVGGLALEDHSSELKHDDFDPKLLLSMDSMDADRFFALKPGEVYIALRSVQILPDDNPNKKRWSNIRGLLEVGFEGWKKDHPDDDEVRF